mmetsp:Transcript_120569/g.300777  ORF Transcript_120569/g.300777 Transcript_120569/m.300777 type:complete len:310 (-) Transcript_120569:2914-3843(-)
MWLCQQRGISVLDIAPRKLLQHHLDVSHASCVLRIVILEMSEQRDPVLIGLQIGLVPPHQGPPRCAELQFRDRPLLDAHDDVLGGSNGLVDARGVSTHCASVPTGRQAVEHGELKAAVVGEAQRVADGGEEPGVDDLPHREQTHGGIERMVLHRIIRCIPRELLGLHALRVVCIALAPAVRSSSADVGDGSLIAVLQVGVPLPLLRRQLLAFADHRGPVHLDLWHLALRYGSQVLPEGLVELAEAALAGHSRHLDDLSILGLLLAVLAGAEAALDGRHLGLCSTLEVADEVDFQVLGTELAADRLPDLG